MFDTVMEKVYAGLVTLTTMGVVWVIKRLWAHEKRLDKHQGDIRAMKQVQEIQLANIDNDLKDIKKEFDWLRNLLISKEDTK